MFDNEV